MCTADSLAVSRINRSHNLIFNRQLALGDNADVHILAVLGLLNIGNGHCAVLAGDNAVVADLRCTADQLDALDPSAVRAKRVGTFGCEALVRRDGVPTNWSVEQVNIEQIMLFLTRGEDAR